MGNVIKMSDYREKTEEEKADALLDGAVAVEKATTKLSESIKRINALIARLKGE